MNIDMELFFNAVRPILGGHLSQQTVDCLNGFIEAHRVHGRGDPRDLAAILGNVKREVGTNMVPVREGFKETDAESRAYVTRQGYKYAKPTKYGGQWAYGRGPVQCTWDYNYEKADKELGLNGALLANFDLALDPKIGTAIAVVGMIQGWFTGKKLADFFTSSVTDWGHCRKIVNGMDHADEVATNAKQFHAAILAALKPDALAIATLVPPPEPPAKPMTKSAINIAAAATAAPVAITTVTNSIKAVQDNYIAPIQQMANSAHETGSAFQALIKALSDPVTMAVVGVAVLGALGVIIYKRVQLAREQGV